MNPVNRKHIDAFTQGDKQEEAILIALFKEQSEENITLLEQYLQQNNIENWRFRAHRLMGVAGSIGAMKLHDICQQAELKGIDTNILIEIKQELACVINFLSEN